MFYNTKIRTLFVMTYVLQHIFDQNLCFIDLSQKNIASHCILVTPFPCFCYITYIIVCLSQKISFDL